MTFQEYDQLEFRGRIDAATGRTCGPEPGAPRSIVLEIFRRSVKLIRNEGQKEFVDLDAGPYRVVRLGNWRLSESFHNYIDIRLNDESVLFGNARHDEVQSHDRRIANLLPLLKKRQVLDDLADT